MKFCVLAYVPPPNVQGAEQFYANLRRFKTKNDLVLYSDHQYDGGIKLLRGSPEQIRGASYSNGQANKWALNNFVFLTGLRVIDGGGYTHFIYVEADCRVNGDFWDGIVVEEFLARNPDAIAAGTVAAYNVCNRDIAFSRAWNNYIVENSKAQFPITSYGGNGASEKHEPAVFPNGALAIYNVEWLVKTYGITNTARKAAEMTAFDYDIGRTLVRQYGNDVFRKVLHMNSVYSSYGDVQTSEGERQQFLTEKRVCAVHQIKSTWPGPDKPLELPDDLTEAPPLVVQAQPIADSGNSKKVEIFIVSYEPDIPYLRYNLKSIAKFCSGFSGVTVLCPRQHVESFQSLQKEFEGTNAGFVLANYTVPKAKAKWHIAHQLEKCRADVYCPDADFILYTDSDCVFFKPVTPADFFRNGAPILCIEPFSRIGNNPWKDVISSALKIEAEYETMRRHGAVHSPAFLREFRGYMEETHGKPIRDWWMDQKADYPWGVTEFNFLGNYALMTKGFPYSFIDVSKEYPPENPIFQFWSHKVINEHQQFPGGGEGVPIDKLKELGLTDDKPA